MKIIEKTYLIYYNLENTLIFVSDLNKNTTNNSNQKDYLDILYFMISKLINDFSTIFDILIKSLIIKNL